MLPVDLKFCPQCGSVEYQYREVKYWYCPHCQFTYYHNVAASASIIAEVDGSILMLVRSKDPGRGMLALPGGFVDADERAEDAAVRECLEETGLLVKNLVFEGSWPNEYIYKNVIYKTCDFYFSAQIPENFKTLKPDVLEVSSFCFVDPDEIETAPIAFDSARNAIRSYLERKKHLSLENIRL